MMKSSRCIHWLTKYYADSAEFCPVSPYQNIFVVGTYQLEENKANVAHSNTNTPSDGRLSDPLDATPSTSEDNNQNAVEESSNETSKTADARETATQTRQGCLYLHKLSGQKVDNLQEIEMAGILDMKWSCQRVSNLVLLGVVTSCGEIAIFKLNENGDSLQQLCKETVETNGALALSLDWSNRVQISHSPCLTVSDSKGNVMVYELENLALNLLHQGNCHSFEAWITAFNYFSPNLVYSGGDDCKFKGFDLRTGFEAPSFISSVHQSGVTSCHSGDLQEHVVATGSYDEVVRVWDDRQWRRPVSEVRVDGGVWRLKWRPQDGRRLLAACMYNNFQIIDVSPAGSSAEVVCRYEEHSSIAYGADWCWNKELPLTAVAASFYDRTASIFTMSEGE